ncbi:lipoprotein NlpI [Rheinheimera sp. MMS21-TC3]|uniref:lipoprotein NlpI n=1 Tax=Rheinheimera sp. MMS21-TC3 TaxID=3072790 RepID=UPI0028C4B361|nr:lipoprotein NlpI [Rheinheimera sp. MMS21-TC3]WNO62081.1 lipoprotein NlpI [Rheinheimera sp. MMS21-TC3]
MLKKKLNSYISQLAPLALLATLLTGCANSHSQDGANNQGWLEPEPLLVSSRAELAIARLTEILYRAELTEVQVAQLYYDRGIMYDSVGLRSLARLDFMRALRLKPDFADIYNFIGIHHTVAGEFNQAYEAFDSVLELEPDHQYAYLNRGIALYYDGLNELAISDFSTFLKLMPSDAYRMLWLYIAESEVSTEQALIHLKQNALAVNQAEWSANLVAFFSGEMTEQALLNSVIVNLDSEKELAERLCEVYFYLAKWHHSQQRDAQALNYYKKVLATNVFEFVEHRYARLEISRLRGEAALVEQDVHL